MTDVVAQPTAWIRLAHLLRPQGRKGELLADLLTDFPERFDEQKRVFLAPAEYTGPETGARAINVSGHWLPVGRNHGRIVLGFEAIVSISEAEELVGLDVLVPVAERIELAEDTEYISDLEGCVVFNGAEEVGTVTGVEFPSTPDGTRRLPDAAPLLTVLTRAGDEVLIPYVQSFIVSLAVDQKQIVMTLPDGLIELNRTDLHRAELNHTEQPPSGESQE